MPDIATTSIDLKNNNLALRMYDSVVFKDGSTYYAKKFDGTLISSSTTPETVLQAALDLKGSIFVAAGNYDIVSTGLQMSSDTHLEFARGAKLRAPNSTVITLLTANNVGWNCSIRGLYTDEQSSYTKKYTGLKLTSSGPGIAFMDVSNCYIYKPDVGIELETTNASGYINGCRFNDVVIHGPKSAGILFDAIVNGDTFGNAFMNVGIEMDSDTTNGVKDISGDGNTFYNCEVWDAVSTSTEWNLKSTASNTSIIGGRIGRNGAFIDLGTRTNVIAPVAAMGPYTADRADIAKFGSWYGAVTSSADGILGGKVAAVVVGTGTNTTGNDSTGTYRTFDTGATINSLTGINVSQTMFNRINHCYFKAAIYLNNNTNVRVFAGFVASGGAPASAADPLNAVSGVALWFDSGVNANWRRLHNDSAGASVSDDTTLAASTATLYPVEIYADVDDSKFKFVFNGTSTDITTDIPASTTQLGAWVYMENTTGASRTFRGYYIVMRNDK